MTKKLKSKDKKKQSKQLKVQHPQALTIFPHYPPFKPIQPPSIDHQFSHKPFYKRIPEAILYSIRKLEYSLSPQGILRHWLKLNFMIMLWLSIPALTILPIILVIIALLAAISISMVTVVHNLLQIALSLGIMAIIVFIIIVFIKK